MGYILPTTGPIPDINNLPLDRPVALVFGREKGITAETRKAANGGLRIPLYGFVESFNVSVACAISVSHLIYRLRKKMPEGFFLHRAEKEKLFHHWLVKNTLIGNLLKKNNRHKEFLLREPNLIS